jgi:hypothetical protein
MNIAYAIVLTHNGKRFVLVNENVLVEAETVSINRKRFILAEEYYPRARIFAFKETAEELVDSLASEYGASLEIIEVEFKSSFK